MDLPLTMRQILITCLRIAGLVFLVVAALSLPNLFYCVAVSWRVGSDGWLYFVDAGGLAATVSFMVKTGLAFALGAFSGRITRWLVPRVSTTCLGCGHPLDPANAGTCPECGAKADS